MTWKKTIYTDEIIREMTERANRGQEARDAYQEMLSLGRFPPDQASLQTFRSTASAKGIHWGGRNAQMVVVNIPLEQYKKFRSAALIRYLTDKEMAERLLLAIINDDMYNAVLDDT